MRLTTPQTTPVFYVLLLEPFLEPQMSMNLIFLIFLLVSLEFSEEEVVKIIKVTGTGSKRKDVFPHHNMVSKGATTFGLPPI